MKYDFCGWATRNDLKCSDGRTIRKDAFKDCDGERVPLVWMHQHNNPENVLGHAMLENRDDGVYAYCSFNNTARGREAKETVRHGDICSLSIYANQLKQKGSDVVHGVIREVSLVLSGANPGAYIESIGFAHGEDGDTDEAIIYTGEELSLTHDGFSNDSGYETNAKQQETKEANELDNNEKTLEDVFNTMNDDQKKLVYALVGEAMNDGRDDDQDDDYYDDYYDDYEDDDGYGEDDEMKHNLFDQEEDAVQGNFLSHADQLDIINDAKRYGSLKESFLAHTATYGIENIDYLFPDAQTLENEPDFISRDMDWVDAVMDGVKHNPFTRIKSMHANITEDEARAKGYIKGKLKKEEVFSLLKRTTGPTTVYKKQKLDRDDQLDITSFDVVAWLKKEMRMMLDEEIARAILIGDGRLTSSDDKIKEDCIRPIWTDADLYTVKKKVDVASTDDEEEKARKFIKAVIRARKDYKGSGNPTLFTTEDLLTSCLLIEDKTGRKIYKDISELATTLRVSEIVTVEVMENQKRKDDQSKNQNLMAILVNLKDYVVGADKGGEVNMFDDFDIDYNQNKYLIETRCSGALVKPYSAVVFEYPDPVQSPSQGG